jgi:hypothetical protein
MSQFSGFPVNEDTFDYCSPEDSLLDSTAHVAAYFASQAGDDESSVASDDVASPALFAEFPDKEFSTFEDLRDAVGAFAGLAPCYIGDNSRRLKCEKLPTQWLRNMFSSSQATVKYSGYLYCRCKESQCEWKVNYKVQQSGRWAVCKKSSCWTHSHDLSMVSKNLPAASGLVHLKSVDQLSVEQKNAIISFLDAGLTVKCCRFKFRSKFLGFELRARCCKTVKNAWLKEKYGADRHQMTQFINQVKRDCNPDAGGVFEINLYENMEIAEVYFQMPLLRAVGAYFGTFSVIDTSHNMSMYERNMATFNVSF